MFDLSAPMKGCVLNQGRYLFLEGDMKYKDNISKVRDNIVPKENTALSTLKEKIKLKLEP